MKINLSKHFIIGIFEYDKDKRNFTEEDTIFVGDGEKFQKWNYVGMKKRIIIRMRCLGMIPMQSCGSIDENGIVINNTWSSNDNVKEVI